MPTNSPKEGLSGLQGSGEALNAPERNAAQAESLSKKVARLATGVAKKVGPLMAAGTLAVASAGCNDNNSSASATATVPAPVPTPTTPAVPTIAPAPAPAPAPTTPSNPFDGAKLTCANLGLMDSGSRLTAENYRRMFVDTQWGLYEPCAPSAIPNEIGKFVTANCNQNGQYKTCVLNDTYADNSGNTVNTETTVNWLTTGYNRVESAQSVGFIFPAGLAARNGVVVTSVDPNAPVVYGQRRILNRQRPVTPSPVTPPAPVATTKKIHPTYDSVKDNEQDARLDALEAEAATNAAHDREQDVRLNNHSHLLRVLIENNAGTGSNPHPTDADYDSLGRRRSTR